MEDLDREESSNSIIGEGKEKESGCNRRKVGENKKRKKRWSISNKKKGGRKG